MLSAPKILIFAGPSGGHLFPAIAFSESFKKRFPKACLELVTTKRGEKILKAALPETFHKYHLLPEFPYPDRKLLKAPYFLLQLIRAFMKSSKLFSKIKPDLCVGFGSFVSYPGMRLASLKKIPTLIHEQNIIPGKATQWLAPHMDQVAVSFDDTLREQALASGVVTGLPLRAAICDKADQRERADAKESKKFNILVVGGSQGAKRINHVFLESLKRLSLEEKDKIAVNHITGTADYQSVQASYSGIRVSHEVHPFSDQMQDHYGRSDMAITRAGANTLFELALFKLPAVVIPYPYAGSHQMANAEYFESRNSIDLCPEKKLTSDWLSNRIRDWMNHSESYQDRMTRMQQMTVSGASEKLVNVACEMLGELSHEPN